MITFFHLSGLAQDISSLEDNLSAFSAEIDKRQVNLDSETEKTDSSVGNFSFSKISIMDNLTESLNEVMNTTDLLKKNLTELETSHLELVRETVLIEQTNIELTEQILKILESRRIQNASNRSIVSVDEISNISLPNDTVSVGLNENLSGVDNGSTSEVSTTSDIKTVVLKITQQQHQHKLRLKVI